MPLDEMESRQIYNILYMSDRLGFVREYVKRDIRERAEGRVGELRAEGAEKKALKARRREQEFRKGWYDHGREDRQWEERRKERQREQYRRKRERQSKEREYRLRKEREERLRKEHEYRLRKERERRDIFGREPINRFGRERQKDRDYGRSSNRVLYNCKNWDVVNSNSTIEEYASDIGEYNFVLVNTPNMSENIKFVTVRECYYELLSFKIYKTKINSYFYDDIVHARSIKKVKEIVEGKGKWEAPIRVLAVRYLPFRLLVSA